MNKLNIQEIFKDKIPSNAKMILAMLNSHGHDAFIVGGFVRNILINHIHNKDLQIKDIDIATSANIEQIKKIFFNWDIFEVGKSFGVIIIANRETRERVEVTTFRKDSEETDGRRPKSIEAVRSIKEDLQRRDFTINAIAINVQLELIDLFEGIDDIKNKVIRSIGDPKTKFSEDFLRIIRGIRFLSQLGFETIDKETLNAMISLSHNLEKISTERIRDEFIKILLSENVSKSFKVLEIAGFFDVFIPEVSTTIIFDNHNQNQNFKKIWDHTIRVVNNVKEADLIVKLSALFHDLGKPISATVDDKGNMSFPKHEIESARIVESRLRKLKFDKETIRKTSKIVANHMNKSQNFASEKAINRLIIRVGEENMTRLLSLMRADVLGSEINTVNVNFTPLNQAFANFISFIQDKSQKVFSLSDIKINGTDIINECNIKEGKIIGDILDLVFNMVVDRQIENDRDTLIDFVVDKFS